MLWVGPERAQSSKGQLGNDNQRVKRETFFIYLNILLK